MNAIAIAIAFVGLIISTTLFAPELIGCVFGKKNYLCSDRPKAEVIVATSTEALSALKALTKSK